MEADTVICEVIVPMIPFKELRGISDVLFGVFGATAAVNYFIFLV